MELADDHEKVAVFGYAGNKIAEKVPADKLYAVV